MYDLHRQECTVDDNANICRELSHLYVNDIYDLHAIVPKNI